MKLPSYSIGSLFVLTAAAALLIPVFMYPGAYLIYLPTLGILLTGVALVRSVRQYPKRRLQSVCLTVLLASIVFAFVSLFDIAANQYREASLFAEQFKRVTQLEDPEGFRSTALALHAQLMIADDDQRLISGDSELVPEEIRKLNPVSIIASEYYLVINMTPSGESRLVIYPSDSTFGRVTAFKVADDFYFWGRQK